MKKIFLIFLLIVFVLTVVESRRRCRRLRYGYRFERLRRTPFSCRKRTTGFLSLYQRRRTTTSAPLIPAVESNGLVSDGTSEAKVEQNRNNFGFGLIGGKAGKGGVAESISNGLGGIAGGVGGIAGGVGGIAVGVGGIAGGVGGLAGGLASGLAVGVADVLSGSATALSKSPVALIKFLTAQISFFKDKLLFIYDDFERVFPLKLELPDFNLFHLLPDFHKKVTFALYDKKHGNASFDILKIDDLDVLKNSRFNPKRPTVFITHGYLATHNGTSVTLVRDAYLRNRDYNVITVNWSPLSIGSYTIARLRVPKVGNHVGNMINFLYKHGMNPNTTMLVGHSLGAHIMGFAGKTASPKVNHTIGLDPAWPLIVGLPKSQRLSEDDAHYVEVIHTNGGLLGIPGITGDYDFYPNGGFSQNGCTGEIFTACSHSRAYKYLAEQVEREGPEYYAVQCDSYGMFEKGYCSDNKNRTIMGALDQFGAEKGNYYLDTKAAEPFGLGRFGPIESD